MENDNENYYELLGINSNSSMEEIIIRYRYLVRVFHPDRFTTDKDKAQAENDLKKINIAYSVLSDTERRQKYDRDLESRKKSSSQTDEPLHPDDPQAVEIMEYIRTTQLNWINKWEPTPNNNELSKLLNDTSKIFFILYKNSYPFDNKSKRDEKFKEFQGRFFYVISSGVALGLEKRKNGIPKNIQEEKLVFVNAMVLFSFLSDIAEIVLSNYSSETAESDKIKTDILEISLRVSLFGYEKFSHQVKIKSSPSPDPRENLNPQRGTNHNPNIPTRSTKSNFGCVILIILIVAVFLAIAFSGQGATTVKVPTATNSKKGLVVTPPMVTPTKKPSYLATTPSCQRWDTVTTKDTGKNLCVYGIVRDTYFEGDTFFITFGIRGSDFRFLVFDGYYFSDITGHCLVVSLNG